MKIREADPWQSKHPNQRRNTQGQVAAKRRRAGKMAAQNNASKAKFGGSK